MFHTEISSAIALYCTLFIEKVYFKRTLLSETYSNIVAPRQGHLRYSAAAQHLSVFRAECDVDSLEDLPSTRVSGIMLLSMVLTTNFLFKQVQGDYAVTFAKSKLLQQRILGGGVFRRVLGV